MRKKKDGVRAKITRCVNNDEIVKSLARAVKNEIIEEILAHRMFHELGDMISSNDTITLGRIDAVLTGLDIVVDSFFTTNSESFRVEFQAGWTREFLQL